MVIVGLNSCDCLIGVVEQPVVPVNVASRPTVSGALYRGALLFKTRDRPMQQVEGTNIYILQTSDCNEDEMADMFAELSSTTFEDWNRYKEIKESICLVQPSAIWENFYSCSCLEGVKKRLCPHSVMVMCEKGILIYPPDAISMNLQQKRKSGRPKLAGTALSMI